MILYLLTFNISALFLKAQKAFKNKKVQKFLLIISALVLILLFGFRYQVGTDYNSYVRIFDIISKLNFTELLNYSELEIGHNILCKLVSLVGLDFRAMFFVYGILIVTFFYLAIDKLKVNKAFFLLGYVLLIFPYSFNVMRQGLATTILIYAIALMINNKKIKSLIFVALAACFHLPSIIMLPLFIAMAVMKKPKNKVILTIVLYLALILAYYLLGANLTNIDMFSKYIIYTTNDANSLTRIMYDLIEKAPLLLLIIFNFKSLKNNEDKNTGLYLAMIVIEIIMIIFFSSNATINRLILYFSIFEIIIIGKITMKKNIVQNSLIYIYLIALFINTFYIKGYGEIFPYQTWIGQ